MELVGGIGEAFSRRRMVSIFFRWGDPVHTARREVISNCFRRKGKTRKRVAQWASLSQHGNRGRADPSSVAEALEDTILRSPNEDWWNSSGEKNNFS
ncbi:MAG: hypothetical protein ABSH48_15645 [Verrucomicrobiota bacterium]